MIRKPFRTPFLRKPEDSEDNDGILEPGAKKRRISSEEEAGVKTIEPRLVFKTPGISSLPRKPLFAVENSSVAPKPVDGGFDGYYNVLWYLRLASETL